jgi:hypothetical protein
LAAIGAGAALAAFSIAGNINTIWEEANAIIGDHGLVIADGRRRPRSR